MSGGADAGRGPRRVAVVLTTRGNYAKMKTSMAAIAAHPSLELVTIVGGGIVQERFGDYRPAIAADGFAIDATADFLVGDGATLAAQAESAGRATAQLGHLLLAHRADVLVAIADRYETLAIATAATCTNVAIAHLEGGEVSGSIDERIRHAVTKLAHLHLPATEDAALRIERMGEARARIVVVGTPSLDQLRAFDVDDRAALSAIAGGSGDALDLSKDFVVVSQHPVPTELVDAEAQIDATAAAVHAVGLPAIWLLPNMDAGGSGVEAAIGRIRARGLGVPTRFFPSLSLESYTRLLRHTRCLVGNSSSGIREGAYLGTPAVNVGSRQSGRQRGQNVVDVPCERAAIVEAIRRQLVHGRYESDPIYGNGRAGERICQAIATMPLALEKAITY